MRKIELFCFVLWAAVALFPSGIFATSTRWVGTWAAAPVGTANKREEFAKGTTLREIVHVSIGGSQFRVVLSNEFGQGDLSIDSATIGLAAADHSGAAKGLLPITFNGHQGVTIPAGALIVSDPVQLALVPLSDLCVSLFLPGQTIGTITQHPLAVSSNFIADGDQTKSATLESARALSSWPFLKAIEVSTGPRGGAIIAFGDSITDGAHSEPDTNNRWPDVLARRLQANRCTANISVLNLGISGNRLLHDIAGPNALARFDRDVLSQDGVRYLIVLEGINDIGRTDLPQRAGDPVTTQQILTALQQIVTRAHAHGILVFGATLTPFAGAKYASPTGETMRSAENTFIRSSNLFDGVIDFDQATRDPANPTILLPAEDSGDHLHPNDAGYKAMGDSIDLTLFEK